MQNPELLFLARRLRAQCLADAQREMRVAAQLAHRLQHVGLEWAWRIWLEPRRLFWRYFTTNPRALYLLFNRSRSSDTNQNRIYSA
jgi:hypothetical protein